MLDIRTGKELNDTYQHDADKVQITRRDFIGGGLAAASAVALAGSANASVRRGLGARLAANFASGSAPLPYDYQVDYITKTVAGATDYFAIPIIPTVQFNQILIAKTSDEVADTGWCGSTTGVVSSYAYMNGSKNKMWHRYGNAQPAVGFNVGEWVRFVCGPRCFVGDVECGSAVASADLSNIKAMTLFIANNYASNRGPKGLSVRRYTITEYGTDAVLLDAIPVVKDGEPQFYYTAGSSSGFLVKNGTNFEAGPRV